MMTDPGIGLYWQTARWSQPRLGPTPTLARSPNRLRPHMLGPDEAIAPERRQWWKTPRTAPVSGGEMGGGGAIIGFMAQSGVFLSGNPRGLSPFFAFTLRPLPAASRGDQFIPAGEYAREGSLCYLKMFDIQVDSPMNFRILKSKLQSCLNHL